MTPYHTLFVRVEYDPAYHGGDYVEVGDFALLPALLVEMVGLERAFVAATGLSPGCIIHWTPDELYDAAGDRVTEYTLPERYASAKHSVLIRLRLVVDVPPDTRADMLCVRLPMSAMTFYDGLTGDEVAGELMAYCEEERTDTPGRSK